MTRGFISFRPYIQSLIFDLPEHRNAVCISLMLAASSNYCGAMMYTKLFFIPFRKVKLLSLLWSELTVLASFLKMKNAFLHFWLNMFWHTSGPPFILIYGWMWKKSKQVFLCNILLRITVICLASCDDFQNNIPHVFNEKTQRVNLGGCKQNKWVFGHWGSFDKELTRFYMHIQTPIVSSVHSSVLLVGYPIALLVDRLTAFW